MKMINKSIKTMVGCRMSLFRSICAPPRSVNTALAFNQMNPKSIVRLNMIVPNNEILLFVMWKNVYKMMLKLTKNNPKIP